MKKALSLILALVLCLGLCACAAEPKETEPAGIELTLDNYDMYLDVFASAYVKEEYKEELFGFEIGHGQYTFVTMDFGQNVYGQIYVKGLSQNFNYTDINVEVRFTGICNHCDLSVRDYDVRRESLTQEPFEFTAICDKVDITGTGSSDGNDKYPIPAGRYIPIVFDGVSGVVYYYEQEDFLNYTYEVISVSGTVTPA